VFSYAASGVAFPGLVLGLLTNMVIKPGSLARWPSCQPRDDTRDLLTPRSPIDSSIWRARSTSRPTIRRLRHADPRTSRRAKRRQHRRTNPGYHEEPQANGGSGQTHLRLQHLRLPPLRHFQAVDAFASAPNDARTWRDECGHSAADASESGLVSGRSVVPPRPYVRGRHLRS
jgi:hypothetical protein